MQITKQDILILLQGGGLWEEYKIVEIGSGETKKLLEQANHIRFTKAVIPLIFPMDFIKFSYSYDGPKMPSLIFHKNLNFENDGYFEFFIHPQQELYVHLDIEAWRPVKIEIITFTLPPYILEASSIKEVDITNTFYTLEDKNVRRI